MFRARNALFGRLWSSHQLYGACSTRNGLQGRLFPYWYPDGDQRSGMSNLPSSHWDLWGSRFPSQRVSTVYLHIWKCLADRALYRLGEATDHFAQTEVEQMDIALKEAEAQNKASGDGSRDASGSGQLASMTNMLSSIPGAGDLSRQAQSLQAKSDAQERDAATQGDRPSQNIPGTNIDPMKTVAQIYPILEFRDKVVKVIDTTIEKIPGLEALVEKITETLTLFVLSLLAPYIRPIIDAVSKQLKAGSGEVIDASGKHQYEPWTDQHCSDPTHSLLSKDHFSNILNEPAGQVAAAILQYVAPRVIYAWQHPDIPLEQVLNDVVRVFHHPALRDQRCELHQNMFSTVERWARSRPDGGSNLNVLLSSDSVRKGRNHTVDPSNQSQTHSHGGLPSGVGSFFGSASQSKTRDGPWQQIGNVRGIANEPSFNSRPSDNPEADYSAQSDPQVPQQYGYGQPSRVPNRAQEQPYGLTSPPDFSEGQSYGSTAAYNPYEGRPSYMASGPDPSIGQQSSGPSHSQTFHGGQESQAPYGGGDPTQGGYLQQPPNYAYGEAPPYSYPTNNPRPPQPYGSEGQPGPYYGGGSY
jgi:hypothetical protein